MAQGSILDSPIEFLTGVGPKRAELLKEELNIYTFAQLLFHFPFRYEDRTKFSLVREVVPKGASVQLKGQIVRMQENRIGRRKVLIATFRDSSGEIDLIWFQGIKWVKSKLVAGQDYVVHGKASLYKNHLNIAHPELEALADYSLSDYSRFEPIYHSTEKLRKNYLDSRGLVKLTKNLIAKIQGRIGETLPKSTVQDNQLIDRNNALCWIHHPKEQNQIEHARRRLKFEEFFFTQFDKLLRKHKRKIESKGFVFEKVGDYFNGFFTDHLPFELTGAQKKVIKEIRRDLGNGRHMNRLLQGDVGSGKTLVALMCMLLAIDNGFQTTIMAPTEILARQHYASIKEFLGDLPVFAALLTGSTKNSERKKILAGAEAGQVDILIGTHALIEPKVIFKNLALAIIDEQQRFGVAQRAALYGKNTPAPHILVMTATPIPRTLKMSQFGDLDVSVIDELPAGRKNIITTQKKHSQRPAVYGFMKKQIKLGRQMYVVYPLIDESKTLDLNYLKDGVIELEKIFKPPEYFISMVHGQLEQKNKELEMDRFVKGETHIMVATTVIEVGVNVPNASVMVIENAERFGLAQLHQLRGRVGRGADQSYCVLMRKDRLSAEAKRRLDTMEQTNDGFRISEVDLELRGPGDVTGLAQSGQMQFIIADLVQDGSILASAIDAINRFIERDPSFQSDEHRRLLATAKLLQEGKIDWSRIS